MRDEVILPTGKVKEIVDKAVEMGVRNITWLGGDVTCHPDWYEIIRYSADRRVRNKMATSGLLSRKEARKVCQLDVWKVGIHLDTVCQHRCDSATAIGSAGHMR